jgi:hypothetical protein
MPTLTADETLVSQIEATRTVSEVRDKQGRVIGLFAPGNLEEARLYLHAWLTLDPADVQRQKASKERTYTYAEVKARLQPLGRQ